MIPVILNGRTKTFALILLILTKGAPSEVGVTSSGRRPTQIMPDEPDNDKESSFHRDRRVELW